MTSAVAFTAKTREELDLLTDEELESYKNGEVQVAFFGARNKDESGAVIRVTNLIMGIMERRAAKVEKDAAEAVAKAEAEAEAKALAEQLPTILPVVLRTISNAVEKAGIKSGLVLRWNPKLEGDARLTVAASASPTPKTPGDGTRTRNVSGEFTVGRKSKANIEAYPQYPVGHVFESSKVACETLGIAVGDGGYVVALNKAGWYRAK